MKQRRYKLFRSWDVILVIMLITLVALTLYFSLSPKRGERAEIYHNGELYQTVYLSEDRIISIDHVEIVIENGTIRVAESDCPDKICVAHGAISKKGQTIVCAPNRIVIKIVGKGEVEAIT